MHFWLICRDEKSIAAHIKLWDLYMHLSCIGHIPCLAWNYGKRRIYGKCLTLYVWFQGLKDGIVMVLNQKYAMRALSCLWGELQSPCFHTTCPSAAYIYRPSIAHSWEISEMHCSNDRGYCCVGLRTEWLYLCWRVLSTMTVGEYSVTYREITGTIKEPLVIDIY